MKGCIRFCELREKNVINRCDCKCLGRVNDFIFDEKSGCICSIIVPCPFRLCNLFGPEQEFVIPWNKICQIGPDIILVEVCTEEVLTQRNRVRNKFC